MRSLLPLLLVTLPASACSNASYTPPSRTMPLETAQAPAVGQTEAQLELNQVGAVLGFDTSNGAARLRHGVTDNLAVSVDLGLLHVNGDSTQRERNAVLGRVGAHVHAPGTSYVALTAGVGGGSSSLAGRWASADVGVVLSGDSKYAVPFLSGEAFVSRPIDPPAFSFQSGEHVVTTQLTPSRGARATAGVALRTARTSRTSLLIGLSWGVIDDAESRDDVLGVGAGLKLSLD